MAREDAIEAVKNNACAKSRLGNLNFSEFLEARGMPVEWAAAGFGGFNCECRGHEDPSAAGKCTPCSNAEAYWTEILVSLELVQSGVWAHDEHMLMSPHRLQEGILLPSDKDWTAWRTKAISKGVISGSWL